MIKERNSGVSRGFAFIDFPSVVLIVDGFSILFSFSSIEVDLNFPIIGCCSSNDG